MKRWSIFDALTLAALGLAAAITAGVYDRLPRRLATHFDARGVANGFMPKATGAWLPLGIALTVWLVMRVGPSFFSARLRERLKESPVARDGVRREHTGLRHGTRALRPALGPGRSPLPYRRCAAVSVGAARAL